MTSHSCLDAAGGAWKDMVLVNDLRQICVRASALDDRGIELICREIGRMENINRFPLSIVYDSVDMLSVLVC